MSRTAASIPGPSLHESDLHHLWLEQRFPPGSLVALSGEPVRVLYRGRPGRGAGPDFRDARIALGGTAPRLGDVELHVCATDFVRHGHATDPAYAHVVLHVVFDATDETTALPGGGVAPVLALRPWVTRRSAEIAAWVARSTPWREPCFSARERLGDGAVRDLLHAGGARRLRAKAEALAPELLGDPPAQVLYRALCGALGLTRNVPPFRTLADRAPLATLTAELEGKDAGGALAAVRSWLERTAGFGPTAPALGALPWRLEGLRPNAHPRARIGGLAALLVRHHARGLQGALTDAAIAGPATLLRALRVPGIGRGRTVELAVNAVLPFLIATGVEALALTLAAALPPADRYGSLSLLDASLAPLTGESVLAQQGALALHADWCRRGGCGVCPLS